ncbi:mpv17, partial [Symbiodinium necroappetens]
DRYVGQKSTFRNVVVKTLFDVYIHTPFGVVPGFYLVTGTFKGDSLTRIHAQLQREWVEASLGSSLFWTPAQVVNFWLVPQPFKIAYVSVLSFAHKTWMSWVSNRDRYALRSGSAPLLPGPYAVA